ncbi:RidA family protein [Mycobacterium shigaense]|uniref:RidA family protein n=1 Tax=Mycobacterium shigaense TaxID=722731 RepID=UPI0013C36DA5|nr:RidA family protein [Mycobacterium shigaense]MEA1120606.1 RidA family protein [Mycobacterium shigaense]
MNNAPTQRFVHAADAPDNTRINIGNFLQAVRIGHIVCIGGTLSTNQHEQRVVDESPEAAIRQAFRNLEAICLEAGASLKDIVMLTAMLTDLSDLRTLNAVQAEFFAATFPAWSTYQVAALLHGRIELVAVAYIGSCLDN